MKILVHPGGSEIEFDDEHAEALMAMPNNGGWKEKITKKSDNGDNSNKDDSKRADK